MQKQQHYCSERCPKKTGADGKSVTVGDVDPSVAEVAGWMSPVPGGVGPMTVAMLLRNVAEAALR